MSLGVAPLLGVLCISSLLGCICFCYHSKDHTKAKVVQSTSYVKPHLSTASRDCVKLHHMQLKGPLRSVVLEVGTDFRDGA